MNNKITRDNKILYVGIVFFVILMILFYIIFGVDRTFKIPDEQVAYDEIVGDYIYKIRYDFGAETYIYLLEDNNIKTVSIQPIYDVCPDTNCMDFTGEYDYVVEEIVFSSEVSDKVIRIFDYLSEQAKAVNFNADELELTKYDQRILLAVLLNSEDMITIEDNLFYDHIDESYKNDNSSFTISKTTLDGATNNMVVNSIANYLNLKVNNGYAEYEKLKNKYLEASGIYNMDFRIDFVYAGPYSLSFRYVVEGALPDRFVYDIYGYTFNYNGDIREFDMGGWKEYYHENAVKEFKKSEFYLENGSLLKKWESALYDNMFLTGNWYLDDEKVVFLISTDWFDVDGIDSQIIEVPVELNEEF